MIMNPPSAIFHIPHSSKAIPFDIRPSIFLSDEELQDELIRMTDSFTDELFQLSDERVRDIVFPVSRLVVDPERFEDDEAEFMAKIGMGVVYTHSSDLKSMRSALSPTERDRLLVRFYRPHHKALYEHCRTAVDSFGGCLIIDCHSFPSKPLPYEFDQSPNRPDICIGSDNFHTPEWLHRAACRLFQENGLTFELNRPYSGAIVPMAYFSKNAKVLSVLIEINRALYMNESDGTRSEQFDSLKQLVQNVLRSLVDEVSERIAAFSD